MKPERKDIAGPEAKTAPEFDQKRQKPDPANYPPVNITTPGGGVYDEKPEEENPE